MGIARRARDWFDQFTLAHVPGAQVAMVSPPKVRFSESDARPIDSVIMEFAGRGLTPRVSRAEALSVPTVQRGRNLLCSIATLPLVQYDPNRVVVRNPLLDQFDEDVPNVVHLSQTVEDLVFDGIAWWRITGFGFDGFPTRVRRLDPCTVSLEPPVGRTPAPLPSGQDPRGRVVYVDGQEVPAEELIRFDSPNPAVLTAGARAILRAILLDRTAALYADDPRPLDYFSPSANADPIEDDDALDVVSRWRSVRKQRGTGWVPASMEYHTVDSPSPADLQLVELQRQAGLDIANAMGIDPEELGISTTSRTYANAVDRRRDKINDVLSPFMRAITDRLSMGDVTKRGYVVRFDLDDYMRANPTERWGVYEKALNLGVMGVEEVRAEEGLPAGAPTVPEPAPVPEPVTVGAARGARVHFAEPGSLTFADLPLTEFSVDREARTITGLAMPYGKVGQKFGMRFRFAKGALQWTDPSRVKLNVHHDVARTVGYAEHLKDTPAGLEVRFKVARGQEGDDALSLAEDKVLDGMSVGVDFDAAADTVPDPRDRGVTLVRRADLRHVALTPEPTFDDARVTSVAASRDQGAQMDPCTTCGQHHAPGVACTATQPAPAGVQFGANDLAQALVTALRTTAQPAPEPAPEQRQTVNPVRLTASVTEAVPYRVDRRGNLRRGTHDFSQDLFAAQHGDAAANDRVMEFMRSSNFGFEQIDFSPSAIVTTDVSALNPNRQRPDMFVDQREFEYPVWNAINKGTLPDLTPFVFPKFNAASGFVNDHTQGTEPGVGTYLATSQTVTPTALSGKAKITRETWDQGGNPQISNLIWRQMQRAWFEGLEAKAVALFSGNAASITDITLTTGGGTTGQTLDAEITAAFAALQYVRGGFTMDTMYTQIDLYKALIAAKDGNGRRLYPSIGATNAVGTVGRRFGAVDINGVLALPAWATAATSSNAASSWLFDSQSAHGWASAPQRLEFNIEVAHVYIGIWGYCATAISDFNGVREVVYDPV